MSMLQMNDANRTSLSSTASRCVTARKPTARSRCKAPRSRCATGEFVAVVGPSGCGKSTLMKVVTGLWLATAGRVMVGGKEVTGPLSIVGMAFQNPTLLPWRTTLDNVMLPLEIVQPHCSQPERERAAYEAKARDLLELVGLTGFEDHFPWQLSGGMQQRTSLCRALIHDPALLMLDEPFASLDMFTREELWLAMQDLWLARKPDRHPGDPRPARGRVPVRPRAGDERAARPHHPERVVELPRPRTLDLTYEPYSVALVQELREHISAAPPAQAA